MSDTQTKSKFWISCVQPTDDHRPLTYPPNEQVLGWWCSGYDHDDMPIVCACVVGIGESIEEREDSAEAAILSDWPEAVTTPWRFFDEVKPDFRPNDRFVMEDWMLERFGKYELEASGDD